MADDDGFGRASPSTQRSNRYDWASLGPGTETDERLGRRWLHRGPSTLAIFAALVLLGGLGTLSPAASATESISVRVFDGDGQPRDGIELPVMYPTLSVWHTLVVELPPDASAETVSLTMTNLRDYEHGCLGPEIEAGDTTCGPGPDQGELSEQMAVQLAVGTTSEPSDASACGDLSGVVTGDAWLRDLEDVALPADLSSSVGAGEGICLALGLEFADLPENNLAMGDESRFDLQVAAHGPGLSGSEVLDVVSEAGEENPRVAAAELPGKAQVLGVALEQASPLARTGAGILVALTFGLLLLAVGRTLVAAGRRKGVEQGTP
jgi:hypothetical protein